MDSPKPKSTNPEEPKPYELEDLWKKADEAARPSRAMTFEEMDEAKARRRS